MNRSASSESRKAAEAVREANKAMVGEMGQSIGEATRRFGEATREMRQAMQELQRDLNTTRDEMKRGVLELPEEAREGAETMRRVVGDQIKALSDLSEIITRHGKQLDLSSPALGEPRPRPVGDASRGHGRRRWRDPRRGTGVALRQRRRATEAAMAPLPGRQHAPRRVLSHRPLLRRRHPPPRPATRPATTTAKAGSPTCSAAPRPTRA